MNDILNHSRLLVGIFAACSLVLSGLAKTNKGYYTSDELEKMIVALENSQDVCVPKPQKIYVDGVREEYVFKCSMCGKSTRYWRLGCIDSGHIDAIRGLVQEIRSLGCDISLDDTRLCQHCHPERFVVERRPVSAVLTKGVQSIPNVSGGLRYVPKEMAVKVYGTSSGATCGITTDNPYVVIERSSVDSNGRLNQDVHASSFVVLVQDEVSRKYIVYLSCKECDESRSLFKGDKVVVEDLPKPESLEYDIVDTNDYSRFCIAIPVDRKLSGYWGCRVHTNDVVDVKYDSGVDAWMGPVFVSVNGGPKRLVKEVDLLLIKAFLRSQQLVYVDFGYCVSTKSKVKRLRELLIPTEESAIQSAKELSELYVTPARKRHFHADGTFHEGND